MNDAERRHGASVLLIVAAVLWWHRWIPALLVTGVVSWVIFHRWLEGDHGEALSRRWRWLWPPSTIMLIPLVSGGTLAYWAWDGPITPKVLPIALNMVALSIVLFGYWWTRVAQLPHFRTAASERWSGPSSTATAVTPGSSRA